MHATVMQGSPPGRQSGHLHLGRNLAHHPDPALGLGLLLEGREAEALTWMIKTVGSEAEAGGVVVPHAVAGRSRLATLGTVCPLDRHLTALSEAGRR